MTPDEAMRDEAARLLSHPMHFPDEFKRWIGDFVATNVPMIPFSHIFGARQNTARSGVYIATSENHGGGGTYTDLATVGPQITQIANGSYLVMYGVRCRSRASISVNGATPSDDDAIWGEEASPAAARMKIVNLTSNDQNTIKLQYKAAGADAYSHRWLVIMRLGAPGI